MAKSYNVTELVPGVRTLDISIHPLAWDFKTFKSVVKSLGNCDIDGDILHFNVRQDNDGFPLYHIYQVPLISTDYLKFGAHRIIFNLIRGTFQIDEDPQIFRMKGYDADNFKKEAIG